MIHWTLVLCSQHKDLQGQPPPQTGLNTEEGIQGGDQKLDRQVSSRGWVHYLKRNCCRFHFTVIDKVAKQLHVLQLHPACLNNRPSWLANGSERVTRALNRDQGPLPTVPQTPNTTGLSTQLEILFRSPQSSQPNHSQAHPSPPRSTIIQGQPHGYSSHSPGDSARSDPGLMQAGAGPPGCRGLDPR